MIGVFTLGAMMGAVVGLPCLAGLNENSEGKAEINYMDGVENLGKAVKEVGIGSVALLAGVTVLAAMGDVASSQYEEEMEVVNEKRNELLRKVDNSKGDINKTRVDLYKELRALGIDTEADEVGMSSKYSVYKGAHGASIDAMTMMGLANLTDEQLEQYVDLTSDTIISDIKKEANWQYSIKAMNNLEKELEDTYGI